MTEPSHLSDLDIQALLDKALDPREARQARAHLATCGDCARRAEAHAGLFAAIEAWADSDPPHDLAPGVLRALTQRATPIGLRVATVLQAGLAVLIVALAWPLVAGLFASFRLPALPGFDLSFSESISAQAQGAIVAFEAASQQLSVSADTWLRLAPQWATLWPAILAGAVLAAIVGNSILLAGRAPGARAARPRRL